jgi:hypothetical protein
MWQRDTEKCLPWKMDNKSCDWPKEYETGEYPMIPVGRIAIKNELVKIFIEHTGQLNMQIPKSLLNKIIIVDEESSQFGKLPDSSGENG